MNADYNEYLKRKKKYHIERIAYLVTSKEWEKPIKVRSDYKTIIDGQHRVWAAKYLDKEEIKAEIK